MPAYPTPTNAAAAAATPDWGRAALDAAIDAARLAEPIVLLDDGRIFAIVPNGFAFKDVTDPDRLGAFVRQTVVLDDAASLSAYTNRFREERSVIIADIDAGTISAHIDWHPPAFGQNAGSPGSRAHNAILRLRPSEEFSRWDEFEGKLHPQAEFAAFLEENASDIAMPEAATMLEISRDLEATQGVTFKSSARLETGDRAFQYETETRTKGDVKVPREFVLSMPIYHGADPVTIRAALRFTVSAGGLGLGFVWRRVEYQRQAQFRQIAFAVAEATGTPVYFGRNK
jgi:uncharacterized protein YfdQ (DUF2303 family)